MASMIPVSGSSYSYAYATLGEGVAFFVACCLILEYGISAAAVAVGWSGYLNKLFEIVLGSGLPPALLSAPLVADGYALAFGGDGVINLPAVLLVFMCCLLLIRGSKESARANAVMVLIKLGVLVMFIVIAVTGFSASNLQPFAPFGFAGISAAAAPSSSPMSASTRSRRRAKRSRTRSAACRSRSSPPWSSSPRSTCWWR